MKGTLQSGHIMMQQEHFKKHSSSASSICSQTAKHHSNDDRSPWCNHHAWSPHFIQQQHQKTEAKEIILCLGWHISFRTSHLWCLAVSQIISTYQKQFLCDPGCGAGEKAATSSFLYDIMHHSTQKVKRRVHSPSASNDDRILKNKLVF